MSALLDSKFGLSLSLLLLPWPTIWESSIFHLVCFTYRQLFPLSSWFVVVSKAQRSCRDRASTNNITFHIHPAHCWRGKAAIAARPPSCILINHHKCLNGKASIAERPRLASTSLLSAIQALSALYTSWVGPPRWIHKWLRSKVIALSFWFSAGCCHGWIQRDPPISPVPRRVAAMERSKVIHPIQVCWRELGPHQEGLLWPSHEVRWIPCWLGSYFSSSSLMTFIPPSILGSSRLVGLLAVLLLRHLLVLLHLLSGWASLHPGEELLRGSWADSEVAATVRFTCFTKSWVGQVACALQLTGTR